jgi:ubiquitin-protein ligase
MNPVNKICMKRLQGDMKLLKKQPLDYVDAIQDDKNMLIWYFLVKGPDDTQYKGGLYIGKIMHNPEYPFKAPDFMMLTPNGRFDIGKKICLTNSGYHSESWSAMWNIRSILLGFMSIMTSDNTTGISHIKRSASERAKMAKNSAQYNIEHHNAIYSRFTRFVDGTDPVMDEIKRKKEKKALKKKEKEQKEKEENNGEFTIKVKKKKKHKKKHKSETKN